MKVKTFELLTKIFYDELCKLMSSFVFVGSIAKQASLDESVQMDTPPRSPPEPLPDEKLLEMVGPAPIPTQLKERSEMSAKQRWIWAYNKIILQLNVSTFSIILCRQIINRTGLKLFCCQGKTYFGTC